MQATIAPPITTRPHNYARTLLYDPDPGVQYYDTIQEYRAALTWAALYEESIPLDQERLQHLDQGIAQAVINLPKDLEPHQDRLDQRLHDLRLRVQSRIASHRARWQALERAIYQTDPQPQDQDDQAPDSQPSSQEQAVRLMRAALLLIMDDRQDRPDGGTKTRLVPPTPTRPPGGSALAHPSKPVPSTDIQF